MKNSLMIPLVFILNLLIWVCSIAFFSVLGSWNYLNALAAGNAKLFVLICGYRVVYVFPVGIMLAFIGVFFFLMRHRTIPFISIPLVVLLAAGSAYFAVPRSYDLLSLLESRFPATVSSDMPLTNIDPGYIRADGNGTLLIDMPGSADGTQYTVKARTGDSARVLSIQATAPSGKSGDTDPLFSSYMQVPEFLRLLVSDCVRVLDAFRAGYVDAFSVFLAEYGSFLLAVVVLWLLCYSSSWRMLNLLFVLALLRTFFLAYPYTLAGPAWQLVRKLWPASLSLQYISPAFFAVFSAIFLFGGGLVFLFRKLKHVRPGAFNG